MGPTSKEIDTTRDRAVQSRAWRTCPGIRTMSKQAKDAFRTAEAAAYEAYLNLWRTPEGGWQPWK